MLNPLDVAILEKRRKYRREWCHKNKDKRLVQWKKCYIKHQKIRQEYGKAYGKKHYNKKIADKVRARRKNVATWCRESARRFRYATSLSYKKRGLPVPPVGSIDALEALISAATSCQYCTALLKLGVKGNVGLDHRIPLSRGGDGSVGNLVICCRSCNRTKGQMTDLEFIDLKTFLQTWEDKGKNILARLRAAGTVFNKN